MDIIIYRIITYLLTVITSVIIHFYEIIRSCDTYSFYHQISTIVDCMKQRSLFESHQLSKATFPS